MFFDPTLIERELSLVSVRPSALAEKPKETTEHPLLTKGSKTCQHGTKVGGSP